MKKNIIVVLCLICMVAAVSCSKDAKEEKFEPDDITAKYFYCMGNFIARNYSQMYPDFDYEAISHGILSAKDNTFMFTDEQVDGIVNEFQSFLEKKSQQQAEINLAKAEEFLKENKKNNDVQETASGLQYTVITQGSGRTPGSKDTVTVDYELSDIDGKVIESTIESGRPASFGLENVIPGFAEGLLLMNEGSTYKLFIHPDLGYGKSGAGSIEPNQVLVFKVTLLKIN